MLTRNAFASLGMVAFLASMVLGIEGAHAQEGGNWQAERARHIQTIDGRVTKVVDKMVTKQMVAKRMQFPWPVKKPTKRKDEVVAVIQGQVDKEAQAKFPVAKRKEFMKEAKEMFRVYQPGELVPEFKLDRVGTNRIVRGGYLRQVTAGRIRVGNRWLIPADLPDTMMARFYEEHSEKAIKNHDRRKNMEYDREIDIFKKKQLTGRLPLSFMNAGYCPRDPSQMQSINANNWWSREDAVNAFYDKVRKGLENQQRSKIEREVFQANGYVKVKEKNNEWMPKAEAEALRAELRAAAEAKNANNMDMFGAGGAGQPGGEPGMMEPGMNSGGSGAPGKKKGDDDLFD